jgi:hypothetical protein
MALFHKKADPISERARALNEEISALESQIKRLDSQLQQRQTSPENPRLRSTAVPLGAATAHRISPSPELTAPPRAPEEPIFEDIDKNRLTARNDAESTPDHYNELGVRKYDLPALFRRLVNHFHGPSTTNPKLVNYLAAGGIQGLRPLRYEKRIARNRFIFFVGILFFALLGLIFWAARRH